MEMAGSRSNLRFLCFVTFGMEFLSFTVPGRLIQTKGHYMKTARPKDWQAVSKFIGVGLSKLRKEKGYDTVKDFAVKYKLPEIQYWRMEKGKANLTLKSLSKVLNIHKKSFERFFCDLDYAAVRK
jgi:hypothetical protein